MSKMSMLPYMTHGLVYFFELKVRSHLDWPNVFLFGLIFGLENEISKGKKKLQLTLDKNSLRFHKRRTRLKSN